MSRDTLKLSAGLLWLGVALMLTGRGAYYMYQVWHIAPDYIKNISPENIPSHNTIIVYAVLGLLIGAVKGKFVLSKSAKRNYERIEDLPEKNPIWLAFSPKFYPLILVMIAMGVGLRYLAAEGMMFSYASCGAVYVGIGAAMGASCLIYFKKKNIPN